jgi:hypothetical protein
VVFVVKGTEEDDVDIPEVGECTSEDKDERDDGGKEEEGDEDEDEECDDDDEKGNEFKEVLIGEIGD